MGGLLWTTLSLVISLLDSLFVFRKPYFHSLVFAVVYLKIRK
jgi:hypothetical protein